MQRVRNEHVRNELNVYAINEKPTPNRMGDGRIPKKKYLTTTQDGKEI